MNCWLIAFMQRIPKLSNYIFFFKCKLSQKKNNDIETQLYILKYISIFCPGDRHVSEIARMALDLLAGSVVFQIPHKPSAKLNIRMGFHRSYSYKNK